MQADRRFHLPTLLLLAAVVLVIGSGQHALADEPPVADAGLARYSATDAVRLDGSGSYDPDGSGPLQYAWQQTSGPMLILADADTAAPTISGFVQTDEVQECEFELVVSDGELTSRPDTVKVIIVPDFGDSTFQLENPSFDPNKPTVIYFGGGDGIVGGPGGGVPLFALDAWRSRANIIDFPDGYTPDSDRIPPTYYKYGDTIIVYLSSVALDYRQPIQTTGWSTGGSPAEDVGIHLNRVYGDARYAVNRVTILDGGCRANPAFGGSMALYTQVLESYVSSSVDGERCWLDFNYGVMEHAAEPFPRFNILMVRSALSHEQVRDWYWNSLTGNDMNQFNGGIVAGAYWSVVGPGKNLQLASDPGVYYFEWDGDVQNGLMDFFSPSQCPGQLPEPVTLLGPVDSGDPNGALLTCCESENAVGYELLFGADPYRVADYTVISDGPAPPDDTISELPYEETWWTVRARDRYGSTIYADPVRVDRFMLSLPVRNTTAGKRYVTIQDAIDAASNGDEIVVSSGPHPYREDIDLSDKSITVRSTDPQDSAVVASTVIEGTGHGSVVTFSGGQKAECVFAGFTITGGQAAFGGGIACIGSGPTIKHCAIIGNVADSTGGGMYVDGGHPILENCIFNANRAIFFGGGISCQNSELILKNCVVYGNTGFLGGGLAANSGDAAVVSSIVRDNHPDQIFGSAVVSYCNVKGGFPGPGNIDVDPLFADLDNADFHLQSQAGRWDPVSGAWVQDDVTSPCIDTGDPSASVGREPQPNAGRINMGAYGGTTQASKSP